MKKMLLAATALLLATANSATLPELKEGLWSVHTESVDQPGNKKIAGTYTLCRNHAYDESVRALAKSVNGCNTKSESFEGGKTSSEVHCVVDGTVIDTKETGTFQGETSFHGETHTVYAPPFYGKTETTIVVDQKYLGNCPAGAQPGDRTDADGRVTHLGRGKR